MCKNCYTTISLWSHTNSGAKFSAVFTGFRICIDFLGVFSHRNVALKKAHWKFFCFESVWKLKLWSIKSQFYFKLLVFLGQDMSFLARDNKFILWWWQASMLNLDIKKNISFKSQNVTLTKKVVYHIITHFSYHKGI